MTFQRLRSLTWREIQCRGRQRLDGWRDVVSPAFHADGRPRGSKRQPVEVPGAHSLDAAAIRFFPGVSDAPSRRRFDQTTTGDAIVDRANAVMDGRFDLLGYRELTFGDPIDWHLDPVSGRRAPLKHWSRLDVLDAASVGDSKVIWELNRHQWMVTLAQAYRLTGDLRFAAYVLTSLEAWGRANPYPCGINWSSSLEASLRLMSWTWAMLLLRDAAVLTNDRVMRWQTLISAHARHVERYLSYYYSPNTHLTGEALGLLYAGLVLAGTPDAARWRDLGRRILVDELARQVTDDGVHFEQATCYQRYTADMYLHMLLLMRRNHLHVPHDVEPAVHRIVRALLMLSQPDGRAPSVGDADGGWLLPLTPRDASDCRGTFGVAAVVFADPEFAWAAGACPPEVEWLCGAEGRRTFARLNARPPAATSTLLDAGGYAVMRTGWEADAHQVIVDVGPLGCPISGAHGHADLLSLQCVAFGEAFLVDPGTYCYTAEPTWRDHFRGSQAHNTLVIDSRSQADVRGPFSWRRRPVAKVRGWKSTSSYDVVDGVHDAYSDGKVRLSHRRRVVFLKPTAWLVIDDVVGSGAHELAVRFQFAPRIVAEVRGDWIRAAGERAAGLWLHVWSVTPVRLDIHEGLLDPIDGWVSPAYGVKVPAPAAVATTHCDERAQLLTIIVPEWPLSSAPPLLEWTFEPSGAVNGVRVAGDERMIQFDDVEVAVTPDAQQRTA